MAEGKLSSINCTQCGAPLELHGGHRVQSITCGFCGSVLDTKEQFKVIKQYLNHKRLPGPIKLGMQGKFNDVEFTTIGMLQFQDVERYRWMEYMLYSPTHGYAWLVYYSGHFVFSRRVRDAPSAVPRPKSKFKARGREFKVLEVYAAEIIYVEGEMPFVAEIGDKVSLIDAIDPPYIFSVERSGNEEEYIFGEYLDPKLVYETFGITEEPIEPIGIHPAQPYVPRPLTVGVSKAAMIFLAPTLAVALLLTIFGQGKVVLQGSANPAQFVNGVQSKPFQIRYPDRLVGLELHSSLSNAWAWFEVEIHRDDKPIFSLGKEISYYSGYSGGEHWSEGSRSASALFKVPDEGTYTLKITGQGGTGNRGATPQNQSLVYKIREGVMVSRYFLGLAILLAIAALWARLARMRFESARWAEYVDDDDD